MQPKCVQTVADLKAALAAFPDDMPVTLSFEGVLEWSGVHIDIDRTRDGREVLSLHDGL